MISGLLSIHLIWHDIAHEATGQHRWPVVAKRHFWQEWISHSPLRAGHISPKTRFFGVASQITMFRQNIIFNAEFHIW